jgi:hypothetical protein
MIPSDISVSRNYFGNGPAQVFIMAKNSARQALYIATGTRGVSLGDPAWIVEKITYDADGDYYSSQFSPYNSIASNYLTLEYK